MRISRFQTSILPVPRRCIIALMIALAVTGSAGWFGLTPVRGQAPAPADTPAPASATAESVPVTETPAVPDNAADQSAPAASGSAVPAAPSATAAAGTPSDAASAQKPEPEELKLPPPPPPLIRTPIELIPYRVEMPVVFQESLRLDTRFQDAILKDLAVAADRSIGPMWKLSISRGDWFLPHTRAGVERLTPEIIKRRLVEDSFYEQIHQQLAALTRDGPPAQAVSSTPPAPLNASLRAGIRSALDAVDQTLRERLVRQLVTTVAAGRGTQEARDTASEILHLYLTPPNPLVDKIFPVSIEMDGPRYIITSREWCSESELLSPAQTVVTTDRRAVVTELLRLLQRLFRPVVAIDEADPTSARIRIKASEYPPADPGFAQAVEGSIFVPFFRYLDRNRTLQRLQFLPWSYITARSVERIRANCSLDTGVKTPLGAFRRRRMEIRAVALKPWLEQTTLTLVPRGRGRPFVGYLVAVYDEPPPPPPKAVEGETAAPTAGPPPPRPDIYRSDRLGSVTIPVDPEHPLQWVYIRSGSALLARFPIVPGSDRQLLAECPDDTVRLDVEGQIVLMQSRLIDTIARREMTKAMILTRSRKEEWDKVKESLRDLDQLPTLESFEKMVEAIQYPAIKKAEARRDRGTEQRIRKLGQEVLKVARIHLDSEKLKDFRDETEELLRVEGAGPPGERRAAPGQR